MNARNITNRTPVHSLLILLFSIPSASGLAETGYDCWLRYRPIKDKRVLKLYEGLPWSVMTLGDSEVVKAAQEELTRAFRGMLLRTLRTEKTLPDNPCIVLGTVYDARQLIPTLRCPSDLAMDGFWIKEVNLGRQRILLITGINDRGVLYGAFALIRLIALHRPVAGLGLKESPAAPIRWVNQWDNLNGTVERGYGGPSIFFENGTVHQDLSRVRDYGRLLASVGINGCTINNVNADWRIISENLLPQIARIADAFRPWGVRISIAVDLSSPKASGELDTFDPLDQKVIDWWVRKVEQIHRFIPDLAGFVVKADSEGRQGPSAYGRTHADAANMLARALRPYGGIVCYRAFVYDHRLDWRNLKNDRAKAAYEHFQMLDGKFDDNVIIQIKNGPIDFQVREPASPLFGALERTNQAIELQITQEYMGQARHMVFLVPMWKEVLDFDTHANGPGTPVKALVAGKTFKRPLGGFIGVANVGMDTNWCGHHMSQANLYGFGRLAWVPDLSARQVCQEWVKLTFGHDQQVVNKVTAMNLASWRVYEDYTGNLGMQTLTDITGNHYGPAVEASERNGWGQWHRADAQGVGMDRTIATGTGFIGQYRPEVAKIYESIKTCPDDLLCWMHHVPYTHRLRSGKTVIQHIYDSHYDGAQQAAGFVRAWRSLDGRIDQQRYEEVLARLQYQAGHAIVWRDAVCSWFHKTSGIPDRKGRVGHYPGRVEAESMQLDGYRVINVRPWEAASGGKAICADQRPGTATFKYLGPAGYYDLAVQYFDQNGGTAIFQCYLQGQLVDRWSADDTLPTRGINSHSSTRYLVTGVLLRDGDCIAIQGTPDANDQAALDYVEILPHNSWP